MMNSSKKKLFFHFFVFWILFSFLPAVSHTLEIPPAPTARVNDYANLLDGAAKAELEQQLKNFEEKTTNQVVVAIFPSLEGESLEDYSIRLAEQWKIGQKGRDNGVILLIFKNDRKLRIEVGYGLEGALPDATAKTIIQNEIVPRFKQGDFKGGVFAGVKAIMAATQGEYKPEIPKQSLGDTLSSWLATVVVFGLFFAVFYFVLLRPILAFFWPLTFPPYKSSSYSGGSSGWSSGGSSGGGWSSGGGGFSGGGGSFGGGGSSGSW